MASAMKFTMAFEELTLCKSVWEFLALQLHTHQSRREHNTGEHSLSLLVEALFIVRKVLLRLGINGK